MNGPPPSSDGAGSADHALSELYDVAVAEVFAYLRPRCGSVELAEDLTSQTFLSAAGAARRPDTDVTTPWLITVARHKLVDHWRRMAVVDRATAVLDDGGDHTVEPWNAVLDQQRAADVLASLSPRHRSVLTLRYLDDLPVSDCAAHLDLSEHATESLLARARRAFRTTYEQTGGHDD